MGHQDALPGPPGLPAFHTTACNQAGQGRDSNTFGDVVYRRTFLLPLLWDFPSAFLLWIWDEDELQGMNDSKKHNNLMAIPIHTTHGHRECFQYFQLRGIALLYLLLTPIIKSSNRRKNGKTEELKRVDR